jgi:ABC-2 type transport system ATP-binding protein
MTILISSHVLSDLAELCTSIGIVELGCLVESTSLESLYQRLSHQQIFIKFSDGFEQLADLLSRTPQIESWTPSPDRRSLTVDFSGSVEDCTALLRSIILADIPISEFHRTQESLEDIFLKLGHQQVS